MSIKTAQGMFPSEKMDRPVYFKNRIQQDYILLLEFEHEVVAYEHEPKRVADVLPAIPVKARPDFLVALYRQLCLVSLVDDRVMDKVDPTRWYVDLLRSYCLEQGIAWVAVRDNELYGSYLIENLRSLCQFSRYRSHLDQALLDRIVEILQVQGQQTIAELMQQVSPDIPQRAAIPIMYLIWRQEISADLHQTRVSTDSVVHVSGKLPGSKELES